MRLALEVRDAGARATLHVSNSLAMITAAQVLHVAVSRVAEWALGDAVDVIAGAADVRFIP